MDFRDRDYWFCILFYWTIGLIAILLIHTGA